MSTTARRGRKTAPIEEPPNRLRELRLKAGYTLEELGDLIGVKAPTLHQAETEGTGIGMKTWFRLADLFRVDPRDLCRPPRRRKTVEKS